MEDPLKHAFTRVKEDISLLMQEMSTLKAEMAVQKATLTEIKELLQEGRIAQRESSTPPFQNTTDPVNSTHTTTVRQEIRGLKYPNLSISTGNEGVSTDRQTHRQTDKSSQNAPEIPLDTNIQEAANMINSLETLKKEVTRKFRQITNQEMTVFSTIYQLEEQKGSVTYKDIATTLNLSESSIRDYTQRLIDKGIPLHKQKINNKKLVLTISPQLRKVASLSTLIQLRER